MLVLLGEDEGYWPVLERTLAHAKISGPKVHDARIAALCLYHEVKELWSANRDFKFFPAIDDSQPSATRQRIMVTLPQTPRRLGPRIKIHPMQSILFDEFAPRVTVSGPTGI